MSSAALRQRFGFLSDNDDGEEESSEEGSGWIQWFCGLEGHDFFCEVDEEYIRDVFNLYGLKSKVENFDKSMEMILGNGPPEDDELIDSELMELYGDSTDLYGLIHARYIISPAGLARMRTKYLEGRFGVCPRVLCNNQKVLPVGLSDELRVHRVRVYCPQCQECFETRLCASGIGVDGSYFGTSFASIFLQAYPALVPLKVPEPFVSKIFGFKLHYKKSIIQTKIEKGEYGRVQTTPSTTRMKDRDNSESSQVKSLSSSSARPAITETQVPTAY